MPEGGVMIHIHARCPDGTTSCEVEDFQAITEAVFANPFDEIIELLEAMNELGIRPEHECFDVDCVMGVTGGIPATARNLAAMVDNIPQGAHWGVIGISRAQWMLVAAALALGGSVRAGLEDNLSLPDGEMARSNGELVARARRMTQDAGRRVATVAQAREMLGVAAK